MGKSKDCRTLTRWRQEEAVIQRPSRELCEVMEVHPLALLTLADAGNSTRKADKLLAQVLQVLKP